MYIVTAIRKGVYQGNKKITPQMTLKFHIKQGEGWTNQN
jgi:hypothetical protein